MPNNKLRIVFIVLGFMITSVTISLIRKTQIDDFAILNYCAQIAGIGGMTLQLRQMALDSENEFVSSLKKDIREDLVDFKSTLSNFGQRQSSNFDEVLDRVNEVRLRISLHEQTPGHTPLIQRIDSLQFKIENIQDSVRQLENSVKALIDNNKTN